MPECNSISNDALQTDGTILMVASLRQCSEWDILPLYLSSAVKFLVCFFQYFTQWAVPLAKVGF